VALIVDVSERLRHERDLEAARDYLGTITSSMADGLLVIGADGRVLLGNAAAGELLGRRARDLPGARAGDVLYAGAGGPLAGGPRPRRGVDDEFTRADGTRLPVTWTSSPMAAGEPGDHVVVFHDATERRLREARLRHEAEGLRWAARLRRALDEGLLELFAQPIVDLARGTVTHHELLLRLRDGAGGHVPPQEFLPAAEEHGLMLDLDTWVLRRAVEVAAGGRPVHVNLSAQSVGEPAVLRTLAQALAVCDVAPGHIIIEITETALTRGDADLAAFFGRLRELGCGVALDDFGTGYNGFSRVKELPVDVLKIDQQFVRDLLDDPASAGVIRAIAGLAADLGIPAVAEGIGDAATLERLRELGVQLGQGFHLGLPMPLR
jgi:PAS domain S-box-containing protein